MKRICAICGKETGLLTSQMVRNNVGTEICKDCLHKAKVNTLKFGCSNITTEELIAKINGEPLGTVIQQESNTANNLRANYNKKTVPCRACGKEVSRQARKCPHCGHPTAGEQLSQGVIGCITAPFIVILIIIAICFYFGLFSGFAGLLQ